MARAADRGKGEQRGGEGYRARDQHRDVERAAIGLDKGRSRQFGRQSRRLLEGSGRGGQGDVAQPVAEKLPVQPAADQAGERRAHYGDRHRLAGDPHGAEDAGRHAGPLGRHHADGEIVHQSPRHAGTEADHQQRCDEGKRGGARCNRCQPDDADRRDHQPARGQPSGRDPARHAGREERHDGDGRGERQHHQSCLQLAIALDADEAVALYVATDDSRTLQMLEGDLTTRDLIAAMLAVNARSCLLPDRPSGCFLMIGATNGGPETDSAQQFLCDRRKDMATRIKNRLERGVAERELPAGLDLDRIAAYFTTVIKGMSIEARDGADADTLSAVARSAMLGWDAITSTQG